MGLQLSNEKDFAHKGHVESFDNRLDADTGSMVLRAEFDNKDGSLTPGLFARIRLPMTAKYRALLVDEKSILTDQANKYSIDLPWIASIGCTFSHRCRWHEFANDINL